MFTKKNLVSISSVGVATTSRWFIQHNPSYVKKICLKTCQEEPTRKTWASKIELSWNYTSKLMDLLSFYITFLVNSRLTFRAVELPCRRVCDLILCLIQCFKIWKLLYHYGNIRLSYKYTSPDWNIFVLDAPVDIIYTCGMKVPRGPNALKACFVLSFLTF
jgi:hypothetical protein